MHRLHSTMAFLAFDVAVDVPLMVKKHMLCHQIDLYPRCGRLRIKISMLFPYPRMLCDNIVMTMKAFFHRGKAWEIGIRHIGMTIAAVYIFYPGMYLMAEWNRLLGADTDLLVCIKEIHECSNEKSRAGGPE
jgi:hypothetical protein